MLGGSLGSLPVVQGILSALPLAEVLDKEPLLGGHVYVAPPDYHVLIEGDHLTLTIDDPVHYARASIDVLFQSAALTYGRQMIAVLIEDPATAHRAALPAATRDATRHARLLHASQLGPTLTELLAASV